MGYPCSRSLSFKVFYHGLALQAAFRHLFNLGLLSPSSLGSSIESSRFASLCLSLPLFASFLGSEENDNNEAWRLSTASHMDIHTYKYQEHRRHCKCRHTQSHSLCAIAGTHTHPYLHTHMQCEMNAGSHKHLFVPHQVCKYMSVVYICNLLQSLHLILYYMPLFYILL